MEQSSSLSTTEGQIVIQCPITSRWLFTGMAMTTLDFLCRSLGEQMVEHCPHCGGAHPWNKNVASLDGPWPPLRRDARRAV